MIPKPLAITARLARSRVADGRPVRFGLDGSGWLRAGLTRDGEALAWLNAIEKRGAGSTVRVELVAEGVLAVHDLQAEAGRGMGAVLRSTCGCDEPLITVRRRYEGPVPPQVLAAFGAMA